MEKEYYTIEIAGLTRNLPICPINEHLSIAGFVMFGDVEMTIACAKELLALAPEFDVIFTPECKSIPLAYEMSRTSGKPYVVARKVAKAYMTDAICVEVKSITTAAVQKLMIGSDDVAMLKGKRVLVIDDVISTGESLAVVVQLAEKAGGIVVAKQAVLAEGDAAKRNDITTLAPLPLIFK